MKTKKNNLNVRNSHKKKSKAKVLLVILAVLALLFLVTLAVIPPVIIGGMVNRHVSFNQVWTGAEFGLASEPLTLTTDDGLNLAAHEVSAENPKAVVIFLSGIHNPSVTAFFGHAEMLLDQGYSSILVEMRAHGESEGEVIALGFKEYLDTRAAVDYIKADPKYDAVPIVVYGLSMGAGTAVNSIGQIPEIDALISLSAFSSWDDVVYDNMVNMGFPKFLASAQKPFVRLYTALKYGFDTRSITPQNEIKKLGDRHALIIHSTEDTEVPIQNFERIVDSAPPHIETWVRQGNLHFIVEGDFLNPRQDQEYANRIISFLDQHFDR